MMERRTVKAKGIPDFKKLHQQWDERMKCTRQSKPTTVTKSFSLGRKKEEKDDCFTVPAKQETRQAIRSKPNTKSSKRQILDGVQKENLSPGKRVRPAQLQKQQGIEFEEDKRALNCILATANDNMTSNAGHRQTFAFGSKTPQASQDPVRNSIYSSSRPRTLGQIEKATMALTSRRATAVGVKAERTINKTPAPPPPDQRHSIYMRCDGKTPRSSSKQLGTPAKVAKLKTPMTARRVPVSSSVTKPPGSSASCVKWADVLTPNKAVQDPLKRALFMDPSCTPPPLKEEPKTSNQSTPNTSQDAMSQRLSLTDTDLRKFQEIEEREQRLLEEINMMSRQRPMSNLEKTEVESPQHVTSKENIDLCAASFRKSADNFALHHKNDSRKNQSDSSEFSSGPSPDHESLEGLKKAGNQVGHSPLSDVDSAVDMASMHNLTIDELNQSLNVSQMQFERLESEFRTLQHVSHDDGDIMKKLQQIEKQQHLVLRQQQDLRKQMLEQHQQLQEQQRLITQKQLRLTPPSSCAHNDTRTPCSVTSGANRRFSMSENSPFALFNRCQSIQKDSSKESSVIPMPTSVKLSPAVILPENASLPLRTPLAMVDSTRCYGNHTPSRYFPPCRTGESARTPLQSVQSAFKQTRVTNSEPENSQDSFEIGCGFLNMTPYTAATTKLRTQLLAKTILSATSKKFQNALLDEEVGLYTSCGRLVDKEKRFHMCCRLMNPVAKTLLEGDHMHFIPIHEESKCHSYTLEGSAFSTFTR
ncbi:uncharacterized protein LOC135500642 [Lineus longissimus]|uniref:uncharacterized protein LOC135500642 n=1 Tax=Lineus longissimus TaxID=88925 RepID=UPI002B4CFDC8